MQQRLIITPLYPINPRTHCTETSCTSLVQINTTLLSVETEDNKQSPESVPSPTDTERNYVSELGTRERPPPALPRSRSDISMAVQFKSRLLHAQFHPVIASRARYNLKWPHGFTTYLEGLLWWGCRPPKTYMGTHFNYCFV